MENLDLKLVPTSDLLEEVLHRFDHAVFSGMRVQNNNDIDTMGRWHGNSFACAGLAVDVQQRCIKAFHDKSRPLTKDEL